MALWPFRRESARKRSRSGAALSDSESLPARSRTDAAVARAASKKKKRAEPNKLQRRARTYSFSPGRHDSIRVDGQRRAQRQNGAGTQAPNGAPAGAWERTPTLYHKRSDLQPTRRKSSKRRREEHEREAEIKAMSAFMPPRANTDAWPTENTRRQSIKRSKTALAAKQVDQPSSNVSLPLQDSLHSSVSNDSDFVSFKISGLGSLAPRPTLRYAPGSRNVSSRASVGGARPSSPKKPWTEREEIAEEELNSRRRIDDLADGLDASDIRELMERDNRRRDRQRAHDQAKAERRLARRAEKQKAAEAEARKSGTPPPENLERGVAGRELVGLGIDPASAVVTSSRHRESPSPEVGSETDQSKQPKPLDSFHRTDTIPLDDTAEQPKAKQPTITEPEESVSDLPQGAKLAGLLKSKKSRSKSTLGSDKERSAIDDYESIRKDSDASGKPNRRSFSALFKWGSRNRRNSGPSSFSNTSREEMQAAAAAKSQAQAQAEALARLQGEEPSAPEVSASAPVSNNYIAHKAGNTLPKRTRSRFREDLPDFPISPPDSRVQSPEAEPPLPIVAESQTETASQPIPIPGSKSKALTNQHSIDELSRTPGSMERTSQAPSPDPHLSISMASIDSEGSWLSGGPGKRRSAALRESLIKANRREQDQSNGSPTNSTGEDLAIADDDYLDRLTPGRNGAPHFPHRESEEGRPSSDAGDDGLKWGAVGARPEIVHTDRGTMHSFQGILNMESSDEGGDSPISPSVVENASLERAHSVSVAKGHGRNYSAGSARLLDITPRASVDSKRLSRETKKSDSMQN